MFHFSPSLPTCLFQVVFLKLPPSVIVLIWDWCLCLPFEFLYSDLYGFVLSEYLVLTLFLYELFLCLTFSYPSFGVHNLGGDSICLCINFCKAYCLKSIEGFTSLLCKGNFNDIVSNLFPVERSLKLAVQGLNKPTHQQVLSKFVR